MNKQHPEQSMGKLYTPTPFEKLVREQSSGYTPHELWEKIGKDQTYTAFKAALDELEREKKIMIHSGLVIWQWDPDGIARVRRTGVRVYPDDGDTVQHRKTEAKS